MTDNDLPLADGFVRAVMEDNARLRVENEALRTTLEAARKTAAEERRRTELHLWRLVRAAGGEVTIPYDVPYDGPKRLLIEDGDETAFGGRYRYRMVPDEEVVLAGMGDVLQRAAA